MIDPAGQQFIDRSVKALCRRVPRTLLQLLGVDPPAELAWEDVSINLPEHRADQVLLIGVADEPRRWALHLEYQLEPDSRLLRSWRLKNAALSEQLGIDVLLVVIYLSPGEYRTFPSEYVQCRGDLQTRFEFSVFKLGARRSDSQRRTGRACSPAGTVRRCSCRGNGSSRANPNPLRYC